MSKNSLLVVALFVFTTLSAKADVNGKPTVTPGNCGNSNLTSLKFICDTIQKVTGMSVCNVTADTCFQARQELFTGTTVELATPNNIKPWNGFGGMGELYQNAGVCMLRDLKFAPLVSTAKATTELGDATIESEVQFLSFDPVTKVVEGYHHAKACAPVIGCLDLFTQKFKFSAVSSSLKGSGQKMGAYEIFGAQGIELETEGLLQGLAVDLPALTVVTPYGVVSAQPRFDFGKAVGWAAAPFNGNVKSIIPSVASGHMLDVYGRTPGVNRCTSTQPTKYGQGWISQLALGSRDANSKTTAWQAPAGVEWPERPDSDISKARSKEEKTPNGYLGANVRIEYSPTDMIPAFLRNNGYISIDFGIFVQPTIEAGFTSQFNFWNAEISQWKGWDYNPVRFDNFRSLGLYGGSSVSNRFALEAGVDLLIKLDIDLGLVEIHKKLINVHPRTTLAESNESQAQPSKVNALAATQLSKVLGTKSLFSAYKPLTGKPMRGEDHIKTCLSKPVEPGKLPEDPTYTPGNIEELVELAEYPCDICIGSYGEKYTDPKTNQEVVIPEWFNLIFPAQVNNKPAALRWSCDHIRKVGCYDMCSYDVATNTLTVIKTAKEMIASGELKGAHCN